jgi:hypothetical protein
MRRISGLVVLASVAAMAAAALASAAPSRPPAPVYANPSPVGSALVNRYFDLLVHKDHAGLERFLAHGFVVLRADGSSQTKAEFLANLPTVESFSLTHVFATESNGTLVVRYLAVATGIINGKSYTPGPAPRLSVFSWSGTRWQLAAHSNFNPLKG